MIPESVHEYPRSDQKYVIPYLHVKYMFCGSASHHSSILIQIAGLMPTSSEDECMSIASPNSLIIFVVEVF